MIEEIIMTSGFPAAGKSSHIKPYIEKGYHNLNLDDSPKKWNLNMLHSQIAPMLEKHGKVILDNTYVTKEQRKGVLDVAKQRGAKVTLLRLTTSIEDAQFNAAYRIATGGREVPAIALFAARKNWEEPSLSEGIDEIVKIPFVRVLPSTYVNKALILDYDGTLRITKSGAKWPTEINDIQIIPGVSKKIKEYVDKGYILLGASNQSAVGKGEMTADQAKKCFEHTNKLLGFDIEFLYCPDASFPVKSYDRKPLPGMGVKHIVKHKLDPSKCIYVGDMTVDKTFAGRCGFQFIDIKKFLE